MQSFLKKETSDNPRKELINLGYQWTQDDLRKAITNRDEIAVDLFVQSKIEPEKFAINDALKNSNEKIQLLLLKAKTRLSSESCESIISWLDVDEVLNITVTQRNLLKQACAGDNKLKDYVKNELKKSELAYQKSLDIYKQDNLKKLSLEDCLKKNLSTSGVKAIIDESIKFDLQSALTYSERELMLAQVNITLVTSLSSQDSSESIKKFISNYCKSQATKKLDEPSDKWVRKWRLITTWIV